MRGIFATLLADDRAPEKAAFGPGVVAYDSSVPLWSAVRSPQEFAKQAQALYHTAPWVHAAERVVSSTFATTPWALEDEDDQIINDDPNDAYTPSEVQLSAYAFMDQPQRYLPDLPATEGRRPGRRRFTRRELWQITRRHAALCGTSFWLLDQTDGFAGTPLAAIYVNPARMWAAEDDAGNLTGWILDWNGRQGMPLSLDEVVPFYFDPPDYGHFGIGIVESAIGSTRLTELGTRHMGGVLSSGGRLAGIIGPKSGTPGGIPDEKYKQLLRDLRNVVEDPNAAKRTIALQGPIEFTPTSATPDEIGVLDMLKMTREDTLSFWGVPFSQVGGSNAVGLNGGGSKDGDKRALWENAVGPWVDSFEETVQVYILDRWQKLGEKIDLDIERPEFDDDSESYDLLTKAESAPITVAERRAIIGLAPFGDKILTPDGALLDDLILLPSMISEAYVASEDLPIPPPPPPVLAVATPFGGPPAAPPDTLAPGTAPDSAPPGSEAGKARWEPQRAVRAQIVQRMLPRLRGAIARLLGQQRQDAVVQVRRVGLDGLRRHAGESDEAYRGRLAGLFPRESWDQRLARAIEPHAVGIASHVTTTLAPRLSARAPGKAKTTFADRVQTRVKNRGAERVKGINATTRERLAAVIAEALDDEEATMNDVIADVEGLTWFGEARAEMIARTESTAAMNDATLGTYGEYGVTQVQAIDGDDDDECRERDGQTYSVEDANDIEDHPNGTLDWAPVVDD